MFVDASALTSMITGEADATELLARLGNHGARETSPLAVWETVVAVSRILDLSVTDGQAEVEAFMRALEIEVREVSAESRALAISAFGRLDIDAFTYRPRTVSTMRPIASVHSLRLSTSAMRIKFSPGFTPFATRPMKLPGRTVTACSA